MRRKVGRVHMTIVTVEKKVISIKYSQYVFVAVVIWHAMRVCRIAICGLCGCVVLPSAVCAAVSYCSHIYLLTYLLHGAESFLRS